MKPSEDPRIARGMRAQLAKRRARLEAGEKHLGWKMGFGAPAAMEKLKISAPLIGYLMQGALLESGATVRVKGWTQPVAEPEIAVRLARDIPPGATRADALAAIATLTPAVEMADLDLMATARQYRYGPGRRHLPAACGSRRAKPRAAAMPEG